MNIYEDYRHEIQSGDLVVWATESIGSFRDFQLALVQIATRSLYDHVGIAWRAGGRLLVVEATPPEIRIFPLSKLTPFYHLKMDIEWRDEYESYLVKHVGSKYSILEAIISFITKPPQNNKWQCAEFVNDFYKMLNIQFTDSYTPHQIVKEMMRISGHGIVHVS